jgi:hypothetical protein
MLPGRMNQPFCRHKSGPAITMAAIVCVALVAWPAAAMASSFLAEGRSNGVDALNEPLGSHRTSALDAWLVTQARRISLGEATERVRQATRGRVLEARDEGSHHRVKILTPQGEVRIVIVDALTGSLR